MIPLFDCGLQARMDEIIDLFEKLDNMLQVAPSSLRDCLVAYLSHLIEQSIADLSDDTGIDPLHISTFLFGEA